MTGQQLLDDGRDLRDRAIRQLKWKRDDVLMYLLAASSW
jgi:hypothetical protein